ncbi:hypothetical protein Tco_1056994 [Tanacetum coccineum]|uniref:Uncharacterized protein n=1 Tax=Tanacetum coccineum TaxID=301880 RepID=A0ABQ5H454_9ASTR
MAPEFWCHSISGAKLSFADVAPLFEFGTKSLTPPLPVLLEQLGHHLHMGPTAEMDYGFTYRNGLDQVVPKIRRKSFSNVQVSCSSLSRAIGVSSRVCKGKGVIAFWAGPTWLCGLATPSGLEAM